MKSVSALFINDINSLLIFVVISENKWYFVLSRPTACFVAKTYKIIDGIKGDKVFVNIVSSESIMTPSKTSTPEVLTFLSIIDHVLLLLVR